MTHRHLWCRVFRQYFVHRLTLAMRRFLNFLLRRLSCLSAHDCKYCAAVCCFHDLLFSRLGLVVRGCADGRVSAPALWCASTSVYVLSRCFHLFRHSSDKSGSYAHGLRHWRSMISIISLDREQCKDDFLFCTGRWAMGSDWETTKCRSFSWLSNI